MQFLLLIFLIIIRPYGKASDKARAIFYCLISIYITFMRMYYNLTQGESFTSVNILITFLPLILIFLLLIGLIMASLIVVTSIIDKIIAFNSQEGKIIR
jgi:hypothetical protein